MELHVNDVAADGDCFYTCFVLCLRKDEMVLWSILRADPQSIEAGVPRLRAVVAEEVCTTQHGRDCLRTLILICKATGDMELRKDHPLLGGARSLKDIARNITAERVWASQIEVGMAQRITAAYDIGLVVVEGATSSAANQLLASLDKVQQERCVVLVRVNDSHYNFISGAQSETIFSTGWLVYRAACAAMLEDVEDQLF